MNQTAIVKDRRAAKKARDLAIKRERANKEQRRLSATLKLTAEEGLVFETGLPTVEEAKLRPYGRK